MGSCRWAGVVLVAGLSAWACDAEPELDGALRGAGCGQGGGSSSGSGDGPCTDADADDDVGEGEGEGEGSGGGASSGSACCDMFDCEDASARPDPDLCGADYTVCNAVEDCCDLPIKGCFAPDEPSGCGWFDEASIAADGETYWEAHFEETVDLAPIMGMYESDHWPASTGVLGLAALGFEAVAVVSAPAMVAIDFIEASQIAINNADDGACQCEYGAELRGKAFSETQSTAEEVYCWRPVGDPTDADRRSCQTEWGYTDCVYEDEVTPIGKRAVLETEDWMCDCGIYPGPRGVVVTAEGRGVYSCNAQSQNLCRCNAVDSPYAAFVACVGDASAVCLAQCSPSYVDCRERDDVLGCAQESWEPFD